MGPVILASRAAPRSPSPTDYAYALLHPKEREFVIGMKKKDRQILTSILTSSRPSHVPLRISVLQSSLPRNIKLDIFEELGRTACNKYLTWARKAIRLPFNKLSLTIPKDKDRATSLQSALKVMDIAVDGHEEPKTEVLRMLCAHFSSDRSSYALGLEGPPGSGKTHFVKNAIALAMGKKFVSIPLGGATDISFLLGNLYVYEGSKEGRLAEALIETGCCDPVIHFDEVDKVSATDKGDEIINCLIHLIDPSCNSEMRDRYFHNIDLDFSKCSFIFSYNDPSKISPILLDRVKRVSMPSPSDDGRRRIIMNHFLPRLQKGSSLPLTLSSSALEVVLRYSTSDSMRGSEKDVQHILSSAKLCISFGSTDASRVGLPGVPVFQSDGGFETGMLSDQFCEGVLQGRRKNLERDTERQSTPYGMYT